jgi:hypothetical protein
MAKRLQRRFVVGQEYEAVGGSKLRRRLKFAARMKIGRVEYLVFAPVRKVSKHRP